MWTNLVHGRLEKRGYKYGEREGTDERKGDVRVWKDMFLLFELQSSCSLFCFHTQVKQLGTYWKKVKLLWSYWWNWLFPTSLPPSQGRLVTRRRLLQGDISEVCRDRAIGMAIVTSFMSLKLGHMVWPKIFLICKYIHDDNLNIYNL